MGADNQAKETSSWNLVTLVTLVSELGKKIMVIEVATYSHHKD